MGDKKTETAFEEAAVLGQPSLQILNASGKMTQKLKIAKMKGVIDVPPDIDLSPKRGNLTLEEEEKIRLDIDKDKDKFFIQLRDPSLKDKEQVVVSLVTQGPDSRYNDESEVILRKQLGDSRSFISDSLLLVSDDIDDQFKVDKIEDNKCSEKNKNCDRTFKTMLESKVSIRYHEKTFSSVAEVPVRKELTIKDLIILNEKPGGPPVISKEDLDKQVKVLKERYAPLGIKINVPPPVFLDPPPGVDITNGLGKKEEQALLEQLGTETKKDLQIFYVKNFDHSDPITQRPAKGFANIEATSQGKAANTIFIDSTSAFFSNVTLAHEVGHILTNKDHFPYVEKGKIEKEDNLEIEFNLIKASPTERGKIYDSKRLNEEQEAIIYKSPLLKEPELEKQSQEDKEEDKKESRSIRR